MVCEAINLNKEASVDDPAGVKLAVEIHYTQKYEVLVSVDLAFGSQSSDLNTLL